MGELVEPLDGPAIGRLDLTQAKDAAAHRRAQRLSTRR
jgi:hypothetical protein